MQQDPVTCPKCGSNRHPSKFAPHLEKCMGMGGRESRRAASKAKAMFVGDAGPAGVQEEFEADLLTGELDGFDDDRPRCVCARVCVCVCVCVWSLVLGHFETDSDTYIHTQTNTNTHTHKHKHTHPNTHTPPRARARAHAASHSRSRRKPGAGRGKRGRWA
jgi:hypothetical protein